MFIPQVVALGLLEGDEDGGVRSPSSQKRPGTAAAAASATPLSLSLGSPVSVSGASAFSEYVIAKVTQCTLLPPGGESTRPTGKVIKGELVLPLRTFLRRLGGWGGMVHQAASRLPNCPRA